MTGFGSDFAPILSFSGQPMQLRDSSQCEMQNSEQFPPSSPSSFSSPSFPVCLSSIILSQQFLSLQLSFEELEQKQKNLLETFQMRRAVRSQEALVRSRTCQERLEQLSNRQREAKEKLQRQQQNEYQYQKGCISQTKTGGELFGTLMRMTPADLLNLQKAKLQKLVDQTAPLFWSHHYHHFRHILPAPPLVSSEKSQELSPRHRLPSTQQKQNSSLKHSHESNDTPRAETSRSSVAQKKVTFYRDGCEKPEITLGKPKEIVAIGTETEVLRDLDQERYTTHSTETEVRRDLDQERYTTHRVAKETYSHSKPMIHSPNCLDAVKTSSLKLLDIEAEKEKSTKPSAIVEPLESTSASHKTAITHQEENSTTGEETIINKPATILPNDAVPPLQVLESCNPPPSSIKATDYGYNDNNVNKNNTTQSINSLETPKADSPTSSFISSTSIIEKDLHTLSCVHSVEPLRSSNANLTVSHVLRRQQSCNSHNDSKSCKTINNAKPSKRLCSFTSFALGSTSNDAFHGQDEGRKFLPPQRNNSPRNQSHIIPLVSESSPRALTPPQLSTSAPSSPTDRIPFLTYSHRIPPQSASSVSPQQPINASLPSPSPPPPDPPPELVPTASFVFKGFSTPSPQSILPPTLFSPSKLPPLHVSQLKSPAIDSPSSPLSSDTLCSQKLLPIDSPTKRYLPTVSTSPQLLQTASTPHPFQQLLPASFPPPCLLPISSSPQELTPKIFLPSQEASSSDSSFPNRSFTAASFPAQRNLDSFSLQFPINVSTSSYAADPTSPVNPMPFPPSRMLSNRFSPTQQLLPQDLSHLSLPTSSQPSRIPLIPSMLASTVSLPPQPPPPAFIISRKSSSASSSSSTTSFSKKHFVPSKSSMAAVPNGRSSEEDNVLSPSPFPRLGSPSSFSQSSSRDSIQHNKYFRTSSSSSSLSTTSKETSTNYHGGCSEISELRCVSSSFFPTSSCENLPPLLEIIEGDDGELIDDKYFTAEKKKNKHSWPIY